MVLLCGSPAHAQTQATSSSPFAGFAGSWSGSGTVALSNGTTERLRCQATYAVASTGTNLQQNLRCTSDTYNFELRTDINAEGGRVTGLWMEGTRNMQGRISGRISVGRIDAVAEGPGFGRDRYGFSRHATGGEYPFPRHRAVAGVGYHGPGAVAGIG